MIREEWSGKDVVGNGRGLVWGTTLELDWRNRGKLQKTLVDTVGLEAEFEPDTSEFSVRTKLGTESIEMVNLYLSFGLTAQT
jgi:hypothetical protein